MVEDSIASLDVYAGQNISVGEDSTASMDVGRGQNISGHNFLSSQFGCCILRSKEVTQ
jgi:hypothetical protein